MDVNKSPFGPITPHITQNQQGNCYNYKNGQNYSMDVIYYPLYNKIFS